MSTQKNQKARYWWAVCYNENMVDGWQDKIGDLLQVPYAYTVHDADHNIDGEDRKTHTHVMLAFSNTTTYNHALEVFSELNAPGRVCCNTCKQVFDVRHAYDYLIHDTEAAQKAGKFKYTSADRVTGNNFDIGAYEQLGVEEKREILHSIYDIIISEGFEEVVSLYQFLLTIDDERFLLVFDNYQGNLQNMCKAIYLRHRSK